MRGQNTTFQFRGKHKPVDLKIEKKKTQSRTRRKTINTRTKKKKYVHSQLPSGGGEIHKLKRG